MDMKNIFIFTYGTLMNNERNHYYLSDQEFISNAYIKNYDIYNLGTYPGIIKGSDIVYGELYSVDENSLNQIDALEELGYLYDRVLERVYISNEESIEAYVYVYLKNINGCIKLNKSWKNR